MENVEAETAKTVAMLREDGEAVLRQIQADADLAVTKLRMEKEAVMKDIDARAKAVLPQTLLLTAAAATSATAVAAAATLYQPVSRALLCNRWRGAS